MFNNQWGLTAEVAYHSKDVDSRLLRGGYDIRMPAATEFSGTLRSDISKKYIAHLEYQYEKAGNNSATRWAIEPGISVRPFSMLKLVVSAAYEENHDELQYVATRDTYLNGKRYVLGTIDQKTLGLIFRVDLNLTPEFSVQYYGSPFISKGSYSELKRVTNPEAKNYNDRFEIYQNPVLNGGNYYLTDYDDTLPTIVSVSNPDFNFHQFRSNLVAKWEYRLGSYVYFVWSSDRTGSNNLSGASFGDSYGYLGDVFPNNIFLIKLSYWFSL